MITIEKTKVSGIEEAIRGMRNPMNSWKQSDSDWEFIEDPAIINPDDQVKFILGDKDEELMLKLNAAGTSHSKYRRMIAVWVDITAPLYWWKEFDTYKVGTVANSCSTMHKLASRDLTLSDFSWEHLIYAEPIPDRSVTAAGLLKLTIDILNQYRKMYFETGKKEYWWQMIQLLPTSYNQERTVMLNYEVLAKIFNDRKGHKLDEWRDFLEWIKMLPYSEIIIGKGEK
jgi:hypothetical protein